MHLDVILKYLGGQIPVEESSGVEVRDALGHVQRQRHPHRPWQLLLAHLDQLFQTSAVDVLKL